MPRNRPDRSREEKAAEIAAIARRLFLEQGYDGTTMAAIAREAGVATNVVHWYFATKDDLFVAALDALQLEGLQQLEKRLAPATPGRERAALEDFLVQLVWRRLDLFGLIATVHERSHLSPVVEAFHREAHRRYEASLQRAVAPLELPDAERKLAIESFVTALEGLVMHRASKAHAKRMMRFLVERLVPESRRPAPRRIPR